MTKSFEAMRLFLEIAKNFTDICFESSQQRPLGHLSLPWILEERSRQKWPGPIVNDCVTLSFVARFNDYLWVLPSLLYIVGGTEGIRFFWVIYTLCMSNWNFAWGCDKDKLKNAKNEVVGVSSFLFFFSILQRTLITCIICITKRGIDDHVFVSHFYFLFSHNNGANLRSFFCCSFIFIVVVKYEQYDTINTMIFHKFELYKLWI